MLLAFVEAATEPALPLPATRMTSADATAREEARPGTSAVRRASEKIASQYGAADVEEEGADDGAWRESATTTPATETRDACGCAAPP
jgi:hypothetical protein